MSLGYSLDITKGLFTPYTGFLTLDSILNGRWDIFVDAWKHLAMPVFTLSIYHWATLGRVARATVLNERRKEYVISARARGVSERNVLWRHVYQNVIAPSLTSMALSAASIVTGVFVAEIIFNFNAMSGVPDASAALGFAIYSVFMVLFLMFLLDVLQAFFDPRVREGVLRS
jgi:peptide/nickel transport system permease protein